MGSPRANKKTDSEKQPFTGMSGHPGHSGAALHKPLHVFYPIKKM
jgi:hypothetical protein